MRVVFIGSSKFGLRCLSVLSALPECDVVGAVTAPAKFSISYRPQGVHNVLHADMSDFCRSNGIPVAIIKQGMREPGLLDAVRAWAPDAFLVAGWYHMIPKAWRALAPSYGLHASLLPDYSGGAPLTWAMINGEKKTGITLFQMEDGVDNGPIVGQAETPIEPDDTISTLYSRIEDLGIALIQTYFPQLAGGTAVVTPQDESRRRLFPQRGPEDGLIDWNQPAERIHDFVRAQTRPYPGAFTLLDGHKLTIWATRKKSSVIEGLAPGQIQAEQGRLAAGCGGGTSLELVDVEGDLIKLRLTDPICKSPDAPNHAASRRKDT